MLDPKPTIIIEPITEAVVVALDLIIANPVEAALEPAIKTVAMTALKPVVALSLIILELAIKATKVISFAMLEPTAPKLSAPDHFIIELLLIIISLYSVIDHLSTAPTTTLVLLHQSLPVQCAKARPAAPDHLPQQQHPTSTPYQPLIIIVVALVVVVAVVVITLVKMTTEEPVVAAHCCHHRFRFSALLGPASRTSRHRSPRCCVFLFVGIPS